MEEIFSSFVKGGDENKIPIEITGAVKSLFDGLIDEETKEMINNFTKAETGGEKFKIINEFRQKQQREQKGKSECAEQKEQKRESVEVNQRNTRNRNIINSIDDLVQERQILEDKLSSLSETESKEFYSKLYQIPTEKDIHTKLDLILEKIEEMQTEFSIMRKQMHSLCNVNNL